MGISFMVQELYDSFKGLKLRPVAALVVLRKVQVSVQIQMGRHGWFIPMKTSQQPSNLGTHSPS